MKTRTLQKLISDTVSKYDNGELGDITEMLSSFAIRVIETNDSERSTTTPTICRPADTRCNKLMQLKGVQSMHSILTAVGSTYDKIEHMLYINKEYCKDFQPLDIAWLNPVILPPFNQQRIEVMSADGTIYHDRICTSKLLEEIKQKGHTWKPVRN